MYGLRSDVSGKLHDLVQLQVRLRRRRRSYVVRLVGVASVNRLAVGIRVDGDGLYPELPTGAHDADCDLAAVGHQDLLEQLLLHGSWCPAPEIRRQDTALQRITGRPRSVATPLGSDHLP